MILVSTYNIIYLFIYIYISIHIARHTHTHAYRYSKNGNLAAEGSAMILEWNSSALWCHVKNQREEFEATWATCLGIHVKYRISELNTHPNRLFHYGNRCIWSFGMQFCCFMWGYVPDNWVITTVIDGPGHVERCTAQRQSKAATSGQHPVQVVWGLGNTKVSYGFFK